MGTFALVVDGIVERLSKAQSIEDINLDEFPNGIWIQASFNTHGGVHYGEDSQPDGGVALRYNCPIIGGRYDAEADAFYGIQPGESWVLNRTTFLWEFGPDVPPKPTVPPGAIDWWVWVEKKKEWVYCEPTEENNP